MHTYGHRNVQGLAERADGTIWSMEHGPDRDDEVNLLVNGGDYGWNPVPGYNESVPMTDHGLPGTQIDAKWSSGYPTVATSGGTFVYGRPVGRATTARSRSPASRPAGLLFLTFDASGNLVRSGSRRRCGSTAGCGRSPWPPTATCWSPPPTAAAAT